MEIILIQNNIYLYIMWHWLIICLHSILNVAFTLQSQTSVLKIHVLPLTSYVAQHDLIDLIDMCINS